MKALTKYLAWLLITLFLTGCEQFDQNVDAVREFFRPPPVLPVRELIQTAVPTGFCAVTAMADQQGYHIPGADVHDYNGFSVIHIKNNHKYPLSLLALPCEEIYILRLAVKEDMCVISSFFIAKNPVSDQRIVYHVSPVPVLLDDQHVKAIFARNHVSVEDELKLDLKISQGDIDIEIERFKVPKPDNVSVAVEQNAWIIEIEAAGTWQNFSDDQYTITGGEQDISTTSYPGGNGASILQMAMIGIKIHPTCLRNPVAGFTVLREISLETGSESQLEDLILGTIFYTFDESCTGKIKVPLATGSFLLSMGKEIDFDTMEYQSDF